MLLERKRLLGGSMNSPVVVFLAGQNSVFERQTDNAFVSLTKVKKHFTVLLAL